MLLSDRRLDAIFPQQGEAVQRRLPVNLRSARYITFKAASSLWEGHSRLQSLA